MMEMMENVITEMTMMMMMMIISGVGEGTSGTSIEVPVVGTLKLSGH